MKLIRHIPALVVAVALLAFPVAASAEEHERDRGKPISAPTTVTAIADPTVAATLAVGAGTSSLAAGTYTVGYAWGASGGTTLLSPTAALTIAAGQTIAVTLPAFPTGVSSADIYLSVAPNATTLGFASHTESATTTLSVLPLTGAVAPPTLNTTATSVGDDGQVDDQNQMESNDDHSDQVHNDSQQQNGESGQHGESDQHNGGDD